MKRYWPRFPAAPETDQGDHFCEEAEDYEGWKSVIRSHKMNRVCLAGIVLAVILSVALLVLAMLVPGESAQRNPASTVSDAYASHIFDDSYVHELDIQLPQVNWDYMVQHAEEEQYVLCNLVIDGELIENVAIRPKGNSSLKAIKTQNSDHFSFKIEFDHYRADNTYYGLDKLALNNLGQDLSCMKDFLSYHMMNEAGVAAPLSSYVHVKLNGEDFGLYLAVEAIEDSFAHRNYGENYGNIYLPECFAINKVTPSAFMDTKENPFQQSFDNLGPGERADIMGTAVRIPFETAFGEEMEAAALKYVGEDPGRYEVFFRASVFEIRKEDRQSLIAAVKKLNSGENALEAVDADSLIRYFMIHNFVNNYDGYTGVFVHNYYLRECDGKLSMIPWDYNLGFGIFTVQSAIKSILGEDSPYQVELQIGQAMDDQTGMINYPIDTPTFTVDTKDRPMLAAILENPETLEEYHRVYGQFLDDFFGSGRFEELYQQTYHMIAPYIEKGQTFYTTQQFEKASQAVHDYCILREESIRRQLDGRLPATMEGQKEDYENLVDASHLNLASSVTFDSLVFGIQSQDVIDILDAIAGNHEHNSQGVTESFKEIKEDSGNIGKMIGRILTSSTMLQKAIFGALGGPVLLILSLVILSKSLKRVKKYSRREVK